MTPAMMNGSETISFLLIQMTTRVGSGSVAFRPSKRAEGRNDLPQDDHDDDDRDAQYAIG
jgi:hypothetical protein